jgi:hypothetical protein
MEQFNADVGLDRTGIRAHASNNHPCKPFMLIQYLLLIQSSLYCVYFTVINKKIHFYCVQVKNKPRDRYVWYVFVLLA